MAKRKCFNCCETGHIAKECPELAEEQDESEDDSSEPPLAGMTLSTSSAVTEATKLFQYYEVCLDSGSQVNIVDPRLLKNIRKSEKTYRSMNGTATTGKVGYLDGFFECQASEDCPANIYHWPTNGPIGNDVNISPLACPLLCSVFLLPIGHTSSGL
jgi:hypothetical protein